MSNGVGMQNFSSNNLQLSDQNKNLTYKVKDGDTIDGDIASIVSQYGDDDLKNSIAQQHDHKDFNKLSQKEQDEALLWFADRQSAKVAGDSKGIKNPDVIRAGQTLNLNQLFGAMNDDGEYGVDGFKGSIELSKINGFYTDPHQKP